METPSAPRQITSHLPQYLTFFSLTGWSRFPKRLGKHFVTLGSTSGPAIRAIHSPVLLAAEVPLQQHLRQPLASGKEGGSPLPQGLGQEPSTIALDPPWCPSNLCTALLLGPGEAECVNHICWRNSSAPWGNLCRVLK